MMEFIEYLPGIWMKEVTEIINEVFKGDKLIKGWEVARIFPIHKGEDEGDVKNYRRVSLLDNGYKIYALILANRLRWWLDKNNKIGESQAGFRKGRGTRDHIFVLNSLINNKIKRVGGKMYACFVDFRTAFDSVDREVMFEKIEKM